MTKLIGTLILTMVAINLGCSTNGGVKGFQKDEVLSTLNDSSRPSWADESKPFVVKDGKVMSIGVTYINGNERPEAGSRISENNARANISKVIENRMEFIFQNAEEGTTYDQTAAHFIGSEVSSITSHSMTNEGMWWQRFAQSQEDGSRTIKYKIYSLITMPEGEFHKAVDKAIEGAAKESKLSQSFQKKVDKQWDRFVEGQDSKPEVGQEAKAE